MSSKRFLAAIITMQLLAPAGFAQEIDQEPSRGTGRIVGGIVTGSVLTALGGLVLLYAGPTSTCYEGETHCAENQKRGGMIGLGLVVLGAGIGVPLIVSGARQKGEWRRWKARQTKNERAAAAPSMRLDIAPLSEGAAAILTLNIP